MTIEEAKEVLGDECGCVSDEQIEVETKTITLFKDVFFNMLKSGKLTMK